ncbi:hypothetical protein BCV72DRAFT_205256 [Rhizopus microsporus var. microsporus]|uniref:Dilute domain-containing protein n=1 Tax=Rhizopus microsporus var. microsporus TaxID=86635 RepID=A0A1X0R6K9_RHIZD|nr:hypothetical protein BCV72DRAFT_205256 [Rhizopus microsporus var. microsporus]
MLSDPEIDPYIVNAGDRDGTPPLVYAACFGKAEVAKVLIEAGADINVQDSSTNHHESIVQLLLNNGASLETKSVKGRTVFDFIGTDDQKMADLLVTDSRDSMSSNASSTFSKTLSSSTSCSSYDFDLCEQDERDCTFQWDKCSPDQMFVFNQDDLQYILDSIIVHFQLPLSNRDDMYIPANIIFLSIRYSFYYSTEPSFEAIIEGVLNRIHMLINPNGPDIHLLIFWIANLTQLLFYLKKDNSLVLATVEQQFQLSELVSELYTALIRDTEQRIVRILNLALLDHDFIPDMEQVQFADSWQRFFFNNSTKNNRLSMYTFSPQTITQLFSSLLHILQSYQVHHIIITQLFTQLYHFISCESFNRILTNKKYICRSKAMQIRMNFSQLEDWASTHRILTQVVSCLNPITQLLQLLQCLTQLQDLVHFIQVIQELNALSPSQIKRCVLSYRYEVNEPRIPDEIEKYTMQCVQDKVRQQSGEANNHRTSIYGRSSLSYFTRPPEQLCLEENREMLNTKIMLPFSLPSLSEMDNEHQALPNLPEEWIYKLDRQQEES